MLLSLNQYQQKSHSSSPPSPLSHLSPAQNLSRVKERIDELKHKREKIVVEVNDMVVEHEKNQKKIKRLEGELKGVRKERAEVCFYMYISLLSKSTHRPLLTLSPSLSLSPPPPFIVSLSLCFLHFPLPFPPKNQKRQNFSRSLPPSPY